MKNNENNNETIMKIMKNVDKNNKQKPWTIMKNMKTQWKNEKQGKQQWKMIKTKEK
jgi:hypothetical protein